MRVKTGFTRHRNHKKIHQATKGFRMTRHKLVKVSKEALVHAGQYAFNGRRKKKGNFRKQWIIKINAALSEQNISYSTFMKQLTQAQIGINRKMLAELALTEPKTFAHIMTTVASKTATS